MENRKEINLFKGKYWISDLGRVKNRFDKILKNETNSKGYNRIKLYGKGGKYDVKHYGIHRLVYCTFNNIDIIFNGNNLICHKDDNPKNNKLSNLFLGTQKDNMQDCISKKRLVIPMLKGSSIATSKLNENDAYNIKQEIKKGVKNLDISKKYNISSSTVCDIKKGRTRNHVSR